MTIDLQPRPSRRLTRWAATAVLAGTLVGAGGGVALADGSGTAADPWVPAKGAHISCQSAGRYQNYTDGSHNLTNQVRSDDYPTLPNGAYISVRYETGDRYAVMAMYHDATTKWAFILRSCVQFG